MVLPSDYSKFAYLPFYLFHNYRFALGLFFCALVVQYLRFYPLNVPYCIFASECFLIAVVLSSDCSIFAYMPSIYFVIIFLPSICFVNMVLPSSQSMFIVLPSDCSNFRIYFIIGVFPFALYLWFYPDCYIFMFLPRFVP